VLLIKKKKKRKVLRWVNFARFMKLDLIVKGIKKRAYCSLPAEGALDVAVVNECLQAVQTHDEI
jgi:hypothetical protein